MLGVIIRFLGRAIFYAPVNENCIREEIKSRLKSLNECYHSVQNLMAVILLSQSIKVKIWRAVILPVGMYGNETWSSTLRGGSKLTVFANRMLRKISEPKRQEVRIKRR